MKSLFSYWWHLQSLKIWLLSIGRTRGIHYKILNGSGTRNSHTRNYWRIVRAWWWWPGIDEYPLPDPTRTFFLLPEPDQNYFSKYPSLGFFPVSCFPVGCFRSFNNGPQILLFSSRPDMKSSVRKSKCLVRRNGSKESQKILTII